MSASLTALDLFAGTGWGVACRILGIDEVGVESMPEARATRTANGMANWLDDVWDVLEAADPDSPEFAAALLIASPPCQTFSMAGAGAGRKALDEVIGLIDSKAYRDPAALRAFGEAHDMRTALVLTPLTYVARHVPTFVVLEQVPTVLPVWERIAVELRSWGYSVVTGVLHAEQYGVPQTRKRAILIARADGVEARMPTPTHSKYHDRAPAKLDEAVEPWISMATALGWGMTDRPYMSIASGTEAGGGADPAALGGSGARRTVLSERDAGRWVEGTPFNEGDPVVFVGNQKPDSKRTSDEPDKYQERSSTKPAPTITSGTRSARWAPGDVTMTASKRSRAATRRADQPAPTITAGHDWGDRQWRGVVNDQSGTPRDASWPERRPATTIATRDLVADPGHNKSRHDNATKSRNDGIRVTLEEAARLQTYPATFDWSPMVPVYRNGVDTGRVKPMSKTVGFRQVGNAVPPLLGVHILSTILD